MPRNGSGSYSLPEAAFVPNTPISSADVNSDFDDVADALTDSLSRSGDGGMQAVLELDNDGFVYTVDPNTGMRRTAGDEQAIECGGVDIVEFTSTGVTVNGDLEVTGDITFGGDPLLLIGEVKIWTGRTAPTKWLLCDGSTQLRASFPDLWTFAAVEIAAGSLLFTNGNGTTTFTVPDLRGRVPAGNDTSAGRLTATTMTPDGNTNGAVGGAQTVTLAAANVPAGVPSANATQSISVTSTEDFIPSNQTGSTRPNTGGPIGMADWGGGAATLGKIHATTNNSISVTSTNAGQTAVNKVQPTILVAFIIYAGA